MLVVFRVADEFFGSAASNIGPGVSFGLPRDIDAGGRNAEETNHEGDRGRDAGSPRKCCLSIAPHRDTRKQQRQMGRRQRKEERCFSSSHLLSLSPAFLVCVVRLSVCLCHVPIAALCLLPLYDPVFSSICQSCSLCVSCSRLESNSLLSLSVSLCLPPLSVSSCLLHMYMYTSIYLYIYLCIPLCTSIYLYIYLCIPLNTSIYTSIYLSIYICIPLYTSIYLYIALCTSLYLCIPLYTSTYLYIPLYISTCLCCFVSR